MKIYSTIAFVTAALLFAGCSKENKTKSIKLGHGLDVTHSVHKAMEFMAKKLEEKSGGKLTIKIYPNQQLGTERECLELLQIGSLGMTKVSAGVLENFAPGMKVFSVPFLFRDKEHSFKVMDSEIGRELLDEGKKYWLKGLVFYDAGSRSFYTKEKEVNKPEDLNGLKIRVQESVSAINMVRAFGGSATPISWGELYTSLQQGIVDGAENNPPSFYLSHHYEVCKYYILDEHTMLPDVILMSTIVWNSLTEQEQQWVQEAANESVPKQRVFWQESEDESLAEVKKAGVEIIYPDKTLFVKKLAGLYEEYDRDPVLGPLIKKISDIK